VVVQERDRQTPMVAVHDSNSVYVNRNPHSSVPVVTTAEPITIFHYEVMSVGDPQVRDLSISSWPSLFSVSCTSRRSALESFSRNDKCEVNERRAVLFVVRLLVAPSHP
jgi:hypothetical protein